MVAPIAATDGGTKAYQVTNASFLASDPFQYFGSRIASLLAWHENAPLPEPEPGSIRAELNQYLQRPVADGPFKVLDVHAQVAADALAVRHHAAEALLRFACARLAPSPTAGAPCLWADLWRRSPRGRRRSRT